MISCVVDSDKSRGINDGLFEGLHGGSAFLSPDEWLVLAGEVVEWASDGGVILDPDMHISCNAEKSTDIAKVLAGWPVVDLGCFGVVQDAAFICTLVP